VIRSLHLAVSSGINKGEAAVLIHSSLKNR
jgi:hypothetical protein